MSRDLARPAVKICGLTRVGDAVAASRLGARWLGLNFWPGSPRAVSLAQAREIAAAVGGEGVSLVGVFVRQPVSFVAEVAAEVGLDLVQLHGDEAPEEVAALGSRAIKVFRVGGEFDRRLLARYPSCWGFLFDVHQEDRFGGTGVEWPYDLVQNLPTSKPVLVAGGIRPGRVQQVVRACRPTGIDVCSGVETAPGIKDPELMRRLFEEIRNVEKEARTAR